MSKTQESPSTVIAVRSSSDLAQLDELDRILLGEVEVSPEVVEDPEAISRSIVMELLGAKSDEELEQFGSAIGWRDLQGVPIEIRGFKWRPSSFEEGAPVYFIVSGTRMDDGSAVTLTTGSMNVLAQLSNMARRGTLVGAIRALKESDKQTGRGFKPLWLYTPEGYAPSVEAQAETTAAA